MNGIAKLILYRRHAVILFLVIGVLALPPLVSAQTVNRTPEKAIQQTKKATAVLERAMSNANERIPKALLDTVVAVAVLADVKKVSLLIEGVGTGRGVVSRRGPGGKWGPPRLFIWEQAALAHK